MSCQGSCQSHQPVTNQEFDFSYFDNSSYGFWPCSSEEQYLETPENGFSDFFDTTTYPMSTWVGSEMNNSLICSAAASKDLMPHQSQSIEDPIVATEPPSRDAEIGQVVAKLQDKMERLEEHFANLQNQLKEENERVCTEVKKNVDKVRDWTEELRQLVVSLVEEPKTKLT